MVREVPAQATLNEALSCMQKQQAMNMYDKALKALERSGFSPDMVGAPDDPCIYINVWTDDMGQAHTRCVYTTPRLVGGRASTRKNWLIEV